MNTIKANYLGSDRVASQLHPTLSQELNVWNSAHRRQPFGSKVAHACDATHFLDPQFLLTINSLGEGFHWHRKLWEYATIADIGRSNLERNKTPFAPLAVGFGVGREPLASFFSSIGYSVIATDQPQDSGITVSEWNNTGQFAGQLDDLWHPEVVDHETFATRVTFRGVDMNDLPSDLPRNSFMWSSCVIEHLGGIDPAVDFLVNSAKLLKPGGSMVHTTELELTDRSEMADYGHCAVFRVQDLCRIFAALMSEGLDVFFSFHVPLGTYQDSHLSVPPYPASEPHLKLVLGDSLTTSYAIIASRPNTLNELTNEL